jgi:hypothetical protein
MQENDNGAAETSKNYNKNYLNDNFLWPRQGGPIECVSKHWQQPCCVPYLH